MLSIYLSLQEPDLPHHPLLQLVFVAEKGAELGEEASQSRRRELQACLALFGGYLAIFVRYGEWEQYCRCLREENGVQGP